MSLVYDPFGRRLKKTRHDTGETTYFAYSDEGLAAEFDASGTLHKTYGYKPGGLWTTDPLYLWTDEYDAAGVHYWYHNDHLGTSKYLTDDTGRVVWSAVAEAFGTTTTDAASSITNNLRFPGQYYDDESGGLHYNWWRYYDAETGRYTREDPIGDGDNWYGYVGGNPIGLVDPTGEVAFLAPVGGAIFGFAVDLSIQWATKGWHCIDWWDVGVSTVIGFVAPGSLGSGKSMFHSWKASRVLKQQLNRAKAISKIRKLKRRGKSHVKNIMWHAGVQMFWQGYKVWAKGVLDCNEGCN